MRRWERVWMEVGRRGEWCVCECVKRDDMGGVNTEEASGQRNHK